MAQDQYVGRWESRLTLKGLPYRIWSREKIVPRIPDHYLRCAFFIYTSKESALAGERFGGSGFLVGVPSTVEGWVHVYAITNTHVLDNGFHVLRLNERDGNSDVIETKPDDWIHHPKGDDVAALALDVPGHLHWWAVSTADFFTPQVLKDYSIGPGDEIFMVGRLVTLEGHARNTPIVRFGNISLVPEEELVTIDGKQCEAFLAECRSLSGFSGSPVFVTADRNAYAPRSVQAPRTVQTLDEATGKWSIQNLARTFGPWLLGIDFAHMPLWRPVYESDKQTRTGGLVDANTGIACVVPAWKILELLSDEEFVKQREQTDAELRLKKNSAKESSAVLDAETDDSGFTRADFEAALKKVSRRLEPSESD